MAGERDAFERAAKAYRDDILAQNPDGFTIASYVNAETLDDAFLAGVAHALSSEPVTALVRALKAQLALPLNIEYGATQATLKMSDAEKRADLMSTAALAAFERERDKGE